MHLRHWFPKEWRASSTLELNISSTIIEGTSLFLGRQLVSYPTKWYLSFILGPLHWSREQVNIVQLNVLEDNTPKIICYISSQASFATLNGNWLFCEHNPFHSSISWIGKSINKCKRCQIKIERFELFILEKRIIFLEKYDVFVSVCNIGKFD